MSACAVGVTVRGLAVSFQVLHLPPAIAGTEKSCRTGYGIFRAAQGWALKQP